MSKMPYLSLIPLMAPKGIIFCEMYLAEDDTLS
jgi:hypothetical protein